ncbi:IclR family transcriptional regulator (plasmid) [Nocardioides sp. R1-1]|uniref:IclR family transcriptional regulator n=1 Tax=Nocardioides sp. R1-1 TaxID=3383502 RepID=UPI0038D0658D
MTEIRRPPLTTGQVVARGKRLQRSAAWNVAHGSGLAETTPGAQSLHRGLVLLDVVAVLARDRPQGVALAELARVTGAPKSSLHRILHALSEAGYVERVEPSGTYRLGLQASVLGQLAASSHDRVVEAASDSLIRLAELSEDTTFLTVRQGTYGLCLRREEGAGAIRNNAMGVGDRHPLGVGAGSLAMLAELDDVEVDQALERNAPVIARNYPHIKIDVLRRLVDETRANGYAVNPGLAAPGSWAIGIAVCDPSGSPRAALSIASIEQRLSGARRVDLAAALRREAALVKAAVTDPLSA